ncbi:MULTISPECIES: phosphopantetheine-binding protein [Snodgrassella]|uniref:Acyl carrier protein n=1 Tax=Snodgrassella alvi SCGC AB-598-J21 TaxID=1385367 RepID=A0A074VF36_9NEIS|nr:MULTISPECIES: phosphopantetheine-binding protein [Snodgrassella]KEQ01100.1 Acyl carrier protein [Snodgrassella alvi SCGC AB-598-J21]KES13831.1 Acyl carrier protein [Snodgrassella alvi SCGC AB-598-P14]MBI0098380.1 acyl carrier protein [Snodgrassella sp. W8134]MBI0102171.1 acyl carrier protein [Snodgrassella sp. W8135]MBI0130035.1 acyl carrier protein [Snodgrassella sp. W8124]
MSDLVIQIKELIIDSLGLEDITTDDIGDDMALFGDDGLGLDSVDALELGLAIQKKFGLQMESDSSQLREYFFSVNTLANYIQSKR